MGLFDKNKGKGDLTGASNRRERAKRYDNSDASRVAQIKNVNANKDNTGAVMSKRIESAGKAPTNERYLRNQPTAKLNDVTVPPVSKVKSPLLAVASGKKRK